ncbi:hypothetical protein V2G26_012011 [Clonostachys chloroleuca]
MMVSRTLPTSNCFRIPFTTGMGRDALVVDIPVLNAEGMNFKESFRLCTTHLESLWGGKAYRRCQLASISALLKGALTPANNIIGGVVGGDMNAIDRSEHDYHRAAEVDLKDVWEDEPAPPPPVLKPFKKDTSYGRVRGNTWGYQSARQRDRKRMDKFFYTGSIKTFAVDDAQDVVGRLGRLGMGMGNLASTYRNQGRWEEAEKLGLQVMETLQMKLGADHPNTLRSMNNLAHTWNSMDKKTEAVGLMQTCIRLREMKLGVDHPHTRLSVLALNSWRK